VSEATAKAVDRAATKLGHHSSFRTKK